MNGPRPHPLDNLIKDESLFLLEALVPFVDYQFKKPLVLFIKYKELTSIIQCLDDKTYLSDCGFDCHPKSTEEMLTNICHLLPGSYGDSIRQMSQMMKMMEMMNVNDMAGQFKANSCNTPQKDNEYNSNEGCSLYDSILSILDEKS